MKDEFSITRRFIQTMNDVSSLAFSIISHNSERDNDFYEQEHLRQIKELEETLEKLEDEFNYQEWSLTQWCPMIRELIDSVEYRWQLQSQYKVWVKTARNVAVWSDEDLCSLTRGRCQDNAVDVEGEKLLIHVRIIINLFNALIEELKIEYELKDEGEEEEADEPTEEKIEIPNYIYNLFKDKQSCEEYFSWETPTADPGEWGRRFHNYGRNRNVLVRNDMKNLFRYLRKIHPAIKDDVDKFRRNLY